MRPVLLVLEPFENRIRVTPVLFHRHPTDPRDRYSRTGLFMSIRTRMRPLADPMVAANPANRWPILSSGWQGRRFPSAFSAIARRKVCQSFSVVRTALVLCPGGIDMSAPSVASGLWPCGDLL